MSPPRLAAAHGPTESGQTVSLAKTIALPPCLLDDVRSPMAQDFAPTPVPAANQVFQPATFTTYLTDVQLDRLNRCANGNTLRFEASSIVGALVAAGYVSEGIGRVVTVTAKGQQYLRTYAVRQRLMQINR